MKLIVFSKEQENLKVIDITLAFAGEVKRIVSTRDFTMWFKKNKPFKNLAEDEDLDAFLETLGDGDAFFTCSPKIVERYSKVILGDLKVSNLKSSHNVWLTGGMGDFVNLGGLASSISEDKALGLKEVLVKHGVQYIANIHKNVGDMRYCY